MDYQKELEAIQTWIKSTTNLNSLRLREAKPKEPRPIILFEMPSRSKDRAIDAYTYVNKVKQFGKLFVMNLDEAADIQEKLIKSLEDNYNIIQVNGDSAQPIGKLKAVAIEFENTDTIDIPFTITYEVTYGRTKPAAPPPASTVKNTIHLKIGG